MHTILVLTRDPAVVERLRSALPAMGLLWVSDLEAAVGAVGRGNVDVCLWDLKLEGSAEAWSGVLAQFRYAAPHLAVVTLGSGTDLAPRPNFVIPRWASPAEVRGIVTDAVALRVEQERDPARAPAPRAATSFPASAVTPAHALTEFSRALASVLELPRAVDTFLTAVGDLVRPARSAVLLPEPGGQRLTVAARRGFQQGPGLVLPVESRLVQWLTMEGRPASLDNAPAGVAGELVRLSAVKIGRAHV